MPVTFRVQYQSDSGLVGRLTVSREANLRVCFDTESDVECLTSLTCPLQRYTGADRRLNAGGSGFGPSVTGIVTDNPALSRIEAQQKETQSYTPLAQSLLAIYSKAQKALGGYKPPRDDRRIARFPKP